jgi:hypothetical protein
MKLPQITILIVILAVTCSNLLAQFDPQKEQKLPVFVGTEEAPYEITKKSGDEVSLLRTIWPARNAGGLSKDHVGRSLVYKYGEPKTDFERYAERLLVYKYGEPRNEFEKERFKEFMEKTEDALKEECNNSVKNLKYALVDKPDLAPNKPYDFKQGGFYLPQHGYFNQTTQQTQQRRWVVEQPEFLCSKLEKTEIFIKVPQDKAEQWSNTKDKKIVVFVEINQGMGFDTKTLRLLADNGDIIAEIPESDLTPVIPDNSRELERIQMNKTYDMVLKGILFATALLGILIVGVIVYIVKRQNAKMKKPKP